MRASSVVLTAVLLLGLTTSAGAQSGSARPGPAQPEPEQQRDAPQDARQRNQSVDVSQLPIDLSRVHRRLQQATIREERDGLRLKFFVDVYGQAPRIELFTRQDNLLDGPVPYGAPTHNQMLEIMTPREFRSPVMDLGALFRKK